MNIGSVIAIYFVVWWTILFAVLPFGVRTQEEEGEITLGTERSAPHRPMLVRKAFATSLDMGTINESLYGGHALLAVGYDDDSQSVLARNSWGELWGLHGYCRLPFELMLSEHSHDWWAIAPPESVALRDRVGEEANEDVADEIGTARWAVYDAGSKEATPGRLRRRQGDPPTGDRAVDEAYNGLAAVDDLFTEVFGRNSFDDSGTPLKAVVHFRRNFANGYWDGQYFVFGDGDRRLFNRFTISIDLIGDTVGKAMIQHTARLVFQNQSGALLSSCANVVGVLARQRALGQTAEEADWLVAPGLLASGIKGEALYSMKAPGTAYDNSDGVLGRDKQVGHMRDYVATKDDSGGVHINSGIPNHAFYLAATRIGGYAWEKAGLIWYIALRDFMSPNTDFEGAAHATISAAEALFGRYSDELRAVESAWRSVGVIEPAPDVSAS
jgi:predicted secreted protein